MTIVIYLLCLVDEWAKKHVSVSNGEENNVVHFSQTTIRKSRKAGSSRRISFRVV